MIWLNPAAFVALAVAAAPILIHLLVHRRAERFAFPTLRFLRPTRLAAIRRHLLEDAPLLMVRIAIVAAAVCAVAGPLIITGPRRDTWGRRVVRAVVVDATSGPSERIGAHQTNAYRAEEFRAAVLKDGIRRGVDWLEHAPPARRELLVAGPLTIGSLSTADLAIVPRDVGISFERTSTMPAQRTVEYASVWSATGKVDRHVTLAGAATSVRDVPAGDRTSLADHMPLDVVANEPARRYVDAAIAAVLSQRVWTVPPARRARLVVAGAPDANVAPAIEARDSLAPWMAEAIARMARDADLQHAASRITDGLGDSRFSSRAWRSITVSADGRTLVAAAASGDHLVVVSGAPPADALTPLLVRALVNGLADVPDLVPFEVVGIADEQLAAWSRPATAPASPRLRDVDADDRRWLWIAALVLLGVEALLRRADRRERSSIEQAEHVRVG